MEQKITTLLGKKEIGLSFTDKPVTPWGGMVLFSGLAREVGLETILRKVIPFQMNSPNATDPVEIIIAFMAGVIAGSRRFAHIERLRWDEGVRQILGIKRFVSDTTMGRFFRRFGDREVTEMFEELTRWQLGMIPLSGEVLDLDSSVMERYGEQEGAFLGHNPKKHRRASHHPLIAVLGNRPWVVHSWLRSGNTGSARGAEAFLEEALSLLPSGVKIACLRADSGFGIEPFLSRVERHGISYAIAARFTKRLREQVFKITDWREIDKGIEVGETYFQALGWSRTRRVVMIRQRAREKDFVRGRELFDDPSYLYQGILTDRNESPEEVWRFYRGHADIENRIRELKWDYGIDGFCQKKFFATEAVFRLVCVVHNLICLLQDRLGFRVYRTLGTLRQQIFACGAIIGRTGNRTVLRLSLSGPWQTRFQSFLRVLFPSENNLCVAVETG